MYEKFYNLTEEPFRLSPNSRFCYRHATYKKAFAYMQYALHRGEGFVMVTGQPGTGKTTLINELTSSMSQSDTEFANLSSTQLEGDDLLRMVAFNFGLEAQHTNKATLLHQLESFFRKTHDAGRRPLLIIDEAQGLSRTALEELRLMTNLQQRNQPLLQIFLVGQEELRELVLSPQLEQLHQRIVAACHLEPLGEDETEHFIKHRLVQVNWRNDPSFDRAIYPLIHQFSLGIPRWINLICSRLMLHGMVEEKHRLGLQDIQTVLQGLMEEQLLPTRLYTGQAQLLQEIAEAPGVEESARDTGATAELPAFRFDAAPAFDDGPAPIEEEQGEPAGEPETAEATETVALAPETETEAADAAFGPVKSSAVLLYTQLQPLLVGQPEDRKIGIFLDFIDGREVEGVRISLPREERERLQALGPGTWFRTEHGSLDIADVSDDIVEIMGLVTWMKRCQPDLETEQLETLGLLFKFMQSERSPDALS